MFDVQMQRDDLGRITQRIEVVDGITRVFHYGYDLAGRLEAVTRNGDLVAHYTYDANGNRVTAEGEAYGGGVPIAATYDDQDRLLTYGAATYTYAPNGELATKTVGGQTTSYVYDTLGNLIQVALPNGDVITYAIDGRGRRVGKSANGVRVKGWLYADQLRSIAELDGDGNVVSRFVYGTKANVPEYMIRGGVTYRIYSDHLGSPRVIVHATTSEIVQRMDFQAFGETIQDSNPGWQPFGFAGGLYDPNTRLVRFGARDYDPNLSRFVAMDPSGFMTGITNLYDYATNDPLNWADQDGQRAVMVSKDPYVQFVLALDAFRDSYKRMRDANTIGGDKYFHCKANCQAARRGEVGRATAEALSFTREWFDTTFKGDSVRECAADMVANAQGRDSNPAVPCDDACASLRPRGLNPRHR